MSRAPGARTSARRRGRWVAAVAVLVWSAGCTIGGEPDPVVPTPSPSPAPTAPSRIDPADAVPVGKVSTAQARRELCPETDAPTDDDRREPGPVPVSVREVEDAIEEIRGLRFLEPVPVVQETRAELERSVRRELARSAPRGFLDRRTLSYRTIGVIGEDDSLADALRSFLGGQVAGFYVPETGRLVVVSQAGEGELDALGEATLAHELTHALDDQHFDIGAIAELQRACRDERATAMTAAVEGSAQLFMTRYVAEHLDLAELGSLALQQETGSLEGVPAFVVRGELWPYTAGQAFVTAIATDDEGAVGEVLRTPPVSTEQVLHPERYPGDAPRDVAVPDLSPALDAASGVEGGGGATERRAWADLDVEDVGEAWLATMLGLRLDREVADEAAAGWDGGVARSWTREGEAVVVLRTVWDTPEDAARFADALRRWLDDGGREAAVIEEPGGAVAAVFASPGAADAGAAATASLRAWASSDGAGATP